MKLDGIRLGRFTNGQLPYYKAQTARLYTAAFLESGLGKPADDANGAGAVIKSSAIRAALVAALDDWAICALRNDERRWLLEVAQIADPHPTSWGERIRDSKTWGDGAVLTELSTSMPVGAQSVSLLLALGERIRDSGGDAPAFLKRVQKEHPADFWANLILGDALLWTKPVEAAGYYRAALASRPGAAVGYTALGDALFGQNLVDEAMGYYQKAVAIDPNYARGHTQIGNMHKRMGQLEEAIKCYKNALAVDSNYGWAHFDLATTLDGRGRLEEAMEHFVKFHEIDPTNSYVTNIVRADMARQGRGEEALLEWERDLAAAPSSHDNYFGYAEMCLFLRHEDQYRRARQDLLRRFGATTDPNIAEKVARACLLLPGTDEETQRAAELAQRAIAAKEQTPEWIFSYFRFAEGLAEFRREHFEGAISIMKAQAGTVMGPAPRLIIAMAEYRKGEVAEARKTLGDAITQFDWNLRHADRRDHFIMHILRREADAMIMRDE